ncbi:PROTEIN DMR6-LIKE OXYGENASE 2 [Salix viminalis]|uniref:PROTEIN DMR6-LIKE OXYGENASE 2 n=1 Tax=Salix viminalis TaxID=40686 RepID=A0A9Q0U662_SALVM|nr:PROTEIN DMR6-LIKE OXYGENASE 2 [Salix viminalis]
MAPAKAVVADDHVAFPAGGKDTPLTKTDMYGLEIWEGTLPIIDMGGLHGPRRADTIKHLANACQHYGGFMLKNHGISEKLLGDIMSTAREFFHLPEEERMKLYSPDPTSLIRLATGFKDEKQNVFVSRESLKFHAHPIEKYVNLWPTNPSSYREVVSEYFVAAKRAEITLLEALFEGLGMQRKSIDQILDNHGQYASLNYYPTCDKSNLGLTFGLRGHTDPTIITMLLPDEVPGLEILQDDDWVPVKPIPNTLIVHVGDVLQGLSNCRYKSLLHRVIVNSETERLSVASYCYPSNDTQMGPPKELIDEDHPLIYKDYTYEDFYTTMWKQRLPDAARLNAFKISAV